MRRIIAVLCLLGIGYILYAGYGSGGYAPDVGQIPGNASITGDATVGGTFTVTGCFVVMDASGCVVGSTTAPFDYVNGVGDLGVADRLQVIGIAKFQNDVFFKDVVDFEANQRYLDNIESEYGTDRDYSIGCQSTRGSLNIVSGNDVTANKLFEITGSSAIFNVPLKRKRTEVALADLGTNTHYSVSATGSEFIVIYTSSPVVLDLPAAAGNDGLHYVIKKDSFTFQADVQSVTLDGNGSETIDGAATNAEIDAWYDALGITCDGDEWFITERYIH